MKILKLHLQNINSLKGEHSFNFEEICAGGSLFAITGATGSGKSSILDALTLALYGRTPRYGSKSSADVMSRHTGECLAEVTFEAHEKQYRSKWSLHRARGLADGKLQTPHMEVAHALDGKILESGVKDTPAAVRELCGLDFDQFRRSVLLAQGDFAAFLRADSNERSKLLERITGTDVYKDISKYAYEKARRARGEWQQLKDRLADINLLDAAEIQRLQARNAEISTLIGERETQAAEFNQKIQLRKNFEQTQNKVQELQAESEQLKVRRASAAEDFALLDKHKLAQSFAADVSQHDDLSAKAARLKSEIADLRERGDKQRSQQDELEQQLNELNTQRAADQANLQELQELLPQIRTLDRQIESGNKELDAAGLVLDIATETLDLREKALEEAVAQRDQFQQDAAEIEAWLKENAADAELSEKLSPIIAAIEAWRNAQSQVQSQADMHTSILAEIAATSSEQEQRERSMAVDKRELEHVLSQLENQQQSDLERDLADLQGREQKLQSALDLLRSINRLQELYSLKTSELREQERKSFELLNQIEQESTELNQVQIQRVSAAENLQLHKGILERERKIQQLESERERLTAGEPCPLCGATEHPFVEQYHENSSSREEEEYHRAESRLRDLEARISALTSSLEIKRAQLQQVNAGTESIKSGLRVLQDEYAALPAQEHSYPKDVTIENTERGQSILESVRLELDDVQIALKNCRQELEQSQKLRSRADSLQAQLSNYRTALDLLARQLQNLNDKRGELEEREKQRSTELEQRAATAKALLEGFVPAAVLRDPPSEREVDALQQRSRYYRENQREFERLQADFQAAGKTVQMQQERCEEAKKSREHEASKLESHKKLLSELQNQRRAIFGSDNADERLQELRASLDLSSQKYTSVEKSLAEAKSAVQKTATTIEVQTRQLSELEAGIAQAASALSQKLAVAGFESIAAQRAAILDESRAARITSTQEELSNSIEQNATLLQDKRQELEELKTVSPSDAEAAELQKSLSEVNAALDKLKQEIGGIAEKLRHNAEQDRQSEQLQILLGDKQRNKTRWELLNELIGSATGQSFSRYAQSLTLQRLVALANRHVIKLNDRYRIRKQASEDSKPGRELELEIVDRHQADTIRPMQSLSGGESFLVSLGLALGLAELAGRNNRIDSLFIDEGFGSLDAATLDSALSVLETLQAQGKTIGVISHVETLKERIANQIQVHKLHGGISTTKVIPAAGVHSIPLEPA